MGIVKEPAGVDLNINPMPLTEADREAVSAVIAHYKQTGELPKPKPRRKKKRAASTPANVQAKPKAVR